MDFLQMKYFIRTAELNNISKAAGEFHVAPSAISTQIRSLEQELQTVLFDRSGNNIALNENGKILYHYANRILQTVGNAQKRISDVNHRLDYELTVATLTIPSAMPYVIRAFTKKYPQIKLRIVQYQKYKDFSEMNCDIMIHSTEYPVQKENSIIIYREPILLAVSVYHPFASRNIVEASMLSGEKFIRGSHLSDYQKIIDRYMKCLGIEPNSSIISDYPPFINELIATNMGVSFLPQLSWYFSREKNIRLLNIKGAEFVRYINITWKEKSYLSEAARLFIRFVSDFFQSIHVDTRPQNIEDIDRNSMLRKERNPDGTAASDVF